MVMPSELAMVHVRSYTPRAEAHAHSFHQMILPLTGCLELEIAGRGGRVSGVTGALVPSGERHAFAAAESNRFLVVDLPFISGEQPVPGEALDRLGRKRFFAVTRGAARLAAWFAEEIPAGSCPPDVMSAFATLLLRAASDPAPRPVPGALRRALAFIEERALEQVRISDVARAAGIGTRQLQALFRAHLGRPPLAVVRTRRLEEARRLLAETELPIAEVALRCGFCDQASLTHAARRELGATPGGLRRHRS